MRAPAILPVFGSALRAWWDDDAPRLGASLAYYTLFAIAPILLVATAIAGMVFGPEAVRGEIVGQLDQLVGRDGALAVEALLEGASQDEAAYSPLFSAASPLASRRRARSSSCRRRSTLSGASSRNLVPTSVCSSSIVFDRLAWSLPLAFC